MISLRYGKVRQQISISLYGEVRKEVIEATLAVEYGIDIEFRETTTIDIERPVGTGAAAESIGKNANPFLTTVGLRVEPAPIDTGVEFHLEVELGPMPFAFMKAVEETVRETLHQWLYGWQVTDCRVTMTHSGYLARQSHSGASFDKSMSSTAGDFRNLTPLVLMTAATPAVRVQDLQQQLPSLSRGESVLESTFDHYQDVRGAVPTRQSSDRNPLNRKEYLMNVRRL